MTALIPWTPLNRRDALRCGAAACGTGLLAACSGGSGGGSGSGSGSGSGGGSGSGVEAPGGAALVALADVPVGGVVAATTPDGDKVLVAQPSEGEVVAFSAVCTHQGCTVEVAGDSLDCPCHGSRFAPLTGEVVSGPAETALPRLAVQVVDGQVVPA